MRKKNLLLLSCLLCWQSAANATDLIEVYQQALSSDQIYQQAISTQLATDEGVPISISQILPNISITADPAVARQGFTGANIDGTALSPRNNTARTYTLALTLNQTIFNYEQFANVGGALATAHGADATLNAALQSLMTRVASAYFAVLKDEDNLSYAEASKLSYKEQLDQVNQQYQVGIKTITDVYTAQASYDSAVATVIAAQTTLTNDRENLRVITGKYYPHLLPLSEAFPLITPKPNNVEQWVQIARLQNWSIKAQEYNVQAARMVIHQQYAGHLPTVSMEVQANRLYTNNINDYPNINNRSGPSTQNDRSIGLNITMPVFAGGGVVAETNQAVYNFQNAQQVLEQTSRNTINLTRQSYLGILSGISQIKADKQAIKSSQSSLEGMEASYRVGTETLVDVLNQQQKVLEAQTQYATDRYAFVNNVLALKQAAGTLSFDDLRALNAWLVAHRPGVKHVAPMAEPKSKAKKSKQSKKQVKKVMAHKKSKAKKIG